VEGGNDALGRALAQFAVAITPSGALVVVKTPPGAAQVVAGAIDGAVLGGVLGTVAGDDTLLVVVDEKIGGWRIAKELERIGGGR
jgi:transcriptional regulator of arginine metabolism